MPSNDSAARPNNDDVRSERSAFLPWHQVSRHPRVFRILLSVPWGPVKRQTLRSVIRLQYDRRSIYNDDEFVNGSCIYAASLPSFFSSYIWRTFFPVSFSRICTFILVISSYCIIVVNRVWVARKFRSVFHSRYISLRVFVTNICDSIFYEVISSVLLLNTAIENNGIGQEIVSQRENVRLRVSRKSKQYVEMYSTAPSFSFDRCNIVLFALIFTNLYETLRNCNAKKLNGLIVKKLFKKN